MKTNKEQCESEVREVLTRYGFEFAYIETRVNGILKSGIIDLAEVEDGRNDTDDC